ncbi:uncharacterized protein [Dermacentor albipictus]
MRDHVHRAMMFVCCVAFATAGFLGLLMVYLVYLAMNAGEPGRLRTTVEESTTVTASTAYTSHLRHRSPGLPADKLRHLVAVPRSPRVASETTSAAPRCLRALRTIPSLGHTLRSTDSATQVAERFIEERHIPECRKQPVFHKCLVNETFPTADRFDQWRGVDTNASGRPWYFLRGSCLEWTPEAFCLEESRAHFAEKKTCARHCERGTPQRRCTRHLPAPLRSNCSSNDEGAPQWWFYDPRSRRCRKWRNVCVRPAYTSYRACAKRCRRRRKVHA